MIVSELCPFCKQVRSCHRCSVCGKLSCTNCSVQVSDGTDPKTAGVGAGTVGVACRGGGKCHAELMKRCGRMTPLKQDVFVQNKRAK